MKKEQPRIECLTTSKQVSTDWSNNVLYKHLELRNSYGNIFNTDTRHKKLHIMNINFKTLYFNNGYFLYYNFIKVVLLDFRNVRLHFGQFSIYLP